MKASEVSVLLKKLSIYFPNQIKFPKDTEDENEAVIRVWLETLQSYSGEEVWQATQQVIFEEPNYAPNPIKIVKKLSQLHSDELTADEAWVKVKNKAEIGHYCEQELPKLAQEALKRVGGLGAIRDSHPNIYHYMFAFKKSYNRLLEQKQREWTTKRLPNSSTTKALPGSQEEDCEASSE